MPRTNLTYEGDQVFRDGANLGRLERRYVKSFETREEIDAAYVGDFLLLDQRWGEPLVRPMNSREMFLSLSTVKETRMSASDVIESDVQASARDPNADGRQLPIAEDTNCAEANQLPASSDASGNLAGR